MKTDLADVETQTLVEELVRRGWRRYGAEGPWTFQKIVEMRENIALGDEIVVAPMKDNNKKWS